MKEELIKSVYYSKERATASLSLCRGGQQQTVFRVGMITRVTWSIKGLFRAIQKRWRLKHWKYYSGERDTLFSNLKTKLIGPERGQTEIFLHYESG